MKTNLNETIKASSFLVGVDEATFPLRNITLLALLSETNCLTNNDGTPIPQREGKVPLWMLATNTISTTTLVKNTK